MQSNHHNLPAILQEITPHLERGLAATSIDNSPLEQQLRRTNCGLATAALQRILTDEYDITTTRMIARLEQAPRGLNSRTTEHVILRTDDDIIDPTYSQFFGYVGLDARRADEERLHHLYPQQKIAHFAIANSMVFARSLASHASSIQQTLPDRTSRALPPLDKLRTASTDELDATYESIYDIKNYQPFTVESQIEDNPSYKTTVERIVNATRSPEHTA